MATNVNDPMRAYRAAKCTALRDRFCGRIRGANPNDTPPVELAINDWSALELMMLDPADIENNPGGPDFHQVLIPEAKQAIADRDAAALREILMLMLKGAWRSA